MIINQYSNDLQICRKLSLKIAYHEITKQILSK